MKIIPTDEYRIIEVREKSHFHDYSNFYIQRKFIKKYFFNKKQEEAWLSFFGRYWSTLKIYLLNSWDEVDFSEELTFIYKPKFFFNKGEAEECIKAIKEGRDNYWYNMIQDQTNKIEVITY